MVYIPTGQKLRYDINKGGTYEGSNYNSFSVVKMNSSNNNDYSSGNNNVIEEFDVSNLSVPQEKQVLYEKTSPAETSITSNNDMSKVDSTTTDLKATDSEVSLDTSLPQNNNSNNSNNNIDMPQKDENATLGNMQNESEATKTNVETTNSQEMSGAGSQGMSGTGSEGMGGTGPQGMGGTGPQGMGGTGSQGMSGTGSQGMGGTGSQGMGGTGSQGMGGTGSEGMGGTGSQGMGGTGSEGMGGTGSQGASSNISIGNSSGFPSNSALQNGVQDINLTIKEDTIIIKYDSPISETEIEIELNRNDYEKFLIELGFSREDINAVFDGVKTPQDIVYEIQMRENKDKRRKMMEQQFLKYFEKDGIECSNMEELDAQIELKRQEAEELIKSLSGEEKELELQALEDLNRELSSNPFVILEDFLSQPVAWKYTDENGTIQYKRENPGLLVVEDMSKYEMITYGDILNNSEIYTELKTQLRVDNIAGRDGYSWSNYDYQEQFQIKLGELRENEIEVEKQRKQKQTEIKAKLEEVQGEISKLMSIRDYINTELNYQFENIDPYIYNSDFIKNSQYKKESIELNDNVKIIPNNEDNTYELIVTGEEEIAKIIISMLNGGEVSNLGTLKFGNIAEQYSNRMIVVESMSNSMIENYIAWKDIITDDEIKVATYIYNTKGAKAAYDYLDKISTKLDLNWLYDKKSKDKEWAQNNEFLASLGSVVVTPIEGLAGIAYSMRNYMLNQKIRFHGVYSSGDVWRSSVAEEIAKTSKNWSFIYSTGMSMVDSLALIGVSVATGGGGVGLAALKNTVLSAGIMGSRAYISTINDCLERGMNDGQAIALSWASAITETAMESYSLGHLLGLETKLGKVVNDATKIISKNIGNEAVAKVSTKMFYILASAISQGIAEGEEEFATEIINYSFDILIGQDLSQYSERIEYYMSLGYQEDDAIKNTISDFKGQIEEAFLGGFLSGLCFGSFAGGKATVLTTKGLSMDLYKGKVDMTQNSAQQFASAIEVNRQQANDYETALKVKESESLTDEQKALLDNGTIEQQAQQLVNLDMKLKVASMVDAAMKNIEKAKNTVLSFLNDIMNKETTSIEESLGNTGSFGLKLDFFRRNRNNQNAGNSVNSPNSINPSIEASEGVQSDNFARLTRQQEIIIVKKINDAIKYGTYTYIINSTTKLSSWVLRQVNDLSRLSVRINGGFADSNGQLKAKYNTEHYIDRITYTGFQALEIFKKLEQLESQINPNGSIVEKARAIYQLITNYFEYTNRNLKKIENGHRDAASLRGIISNNVLGEEGLVCAGFSQLFKELCDRLGVPCEYIRGQVPFINEDGEWDYENHAWNVVIDGNTVIPIDVTWRNISKWFGPSEEFASRHIADRDEKYRNYRPGENRIASPVQVQRVNNNNPGRSQQIILLDNIIARMDEKNRMKPGYGSGLYHLKKYYETGNLNQITNDNNYRQLIQYVSRDIIEEYLRQKGALPGQKQQAYNLLDNIVSRMDAKNSMDSKYGNGLGHLRRYYEFGNPREITGDNNYRQQIQSIPRSVIAEYLISRGIYVTLNENASLDNNTENTSEMSFNQSFFDKMFAGLETEEQKIEAFKKSGIDMENLEDYELNILFKHFEKSSEFKKEIFNNMSRQYQIANIVNLDVDDQIEALKQFSDEDKIESLIYYDSFINLVPKILKTMDNISDEKKIELLDEVFNNTTKLEIIKSMKTDDAKLKAIDQLNSTTYIIKAAQSLESEQSRLDVLEKEISKYEDRGLILYRVAGEIIDLIESLTQEDLIIKGLDYLVDCPYKDALIKKIPSSRKAFSNGSILSKEDSKNLMNAINEISKQDGLEQAIQKLYKYSLNNNQDSVYYNLLGNSFSAETIKEYLDMLQNRFNNNPYLYYLASLSTEDFISEIKGSDKKLGVNQGVFKSLILRNPNEYKRLVEVFSERYNMDKKSVAKAMQIVDSVGACSYGSLITALVYSNYRYDPMLFEKKFGFPLYIQDEKGNLSLNSAELLFDMYHFANDVSNGGNLFEDGKVLVNKATNQVYMTDNLSLLNEYLKSHGIENLFEKGLTHLPSTLYYNVENSDKKQKIIEFLQYYSPETNALVLDYDWYGINNVIKSFFKSFKIKKAQISLTLVEEQNPLNRVTYRFGDSGHAIAILGYNENGVKVNTWGKNWIIPWKSIENNNNYYITVYKNRGGYIIP